MTKRPIDRVRDSGGSMTFGTDGDAGEIDGMFEINGSLHTIMTKAIFVTKLADEIDPDRTNIGIPNVSQKVLDVGTDAAYVRSILMQANRLFKDKVLGPDFDYQAAMNLSFEVLKDVVGLEQTRQSVRAKLTAIEDDIKALKVDPQRRQLAVPAVGDVWGLVEAFSQRADHAVMDLFKIAKLFYGRELDKGWFTALRDKVKASYGPDDQFTKFMEAVLPFLLFVRNLRNAVEHADESKRVVVTDITLGPDGNLKPPTIEVIHRDTPQPETHLLQFLDRIVDHLVRIFEQMIVHMSARHVQPQAGMPLELGPFTPDQARAYKCSYGYGCWFGDQWAPFG